MSSIADHTGILISKPTQGMDVRVYSVIVCM
jgi:hypothetical protein